MSTAFPHVGVVSGDGLVARFGDAVVVLGRAADRQTSSTDGVSALLGELERWSGSPNPSPDEVSWTLAAQLIAHRGVLPSIGAAIRVAGGYRVFLHGPTRAVVAGPDGDRELLGTSAVTWVDVMVDEPLTSLSISVDGPGPIRAQPQSDLRGGLVNGNGVGAPPMRCHSAAPAAAMNVPFVDRLSRTVTTPARTSRYTWAREIRLSGSRTATGDAAPRVTSGSRCGSRPST